MAVRCCWPAPGTPTAPCVEDEGHSLGAVTGLELRVNCIQVVEVPPPLIMTSPAKSLAECVAAEP